MALWTGIQKDMGRDWFERTESVVWKGRTVFGPGVARYAGSSANSETLEVRGPFFLSSGSYLLWNSAKSGVLKLEGTDRVEASNAKYAYNPFGAAEPYSANYPWSRLLKAPAPPAKPAPAMSAPSPPS